MTGPALDPELAAAYVHELSAEVLAVVVLDDAGQRLAGEERLVTPAHEVAEAIGHGVACTGDGVVWVARGEGRTLVALAGSGAQPGPTALDARIAAISADLPLFDDPTPAQRIALKAAVEAAFAVANSR